MSEPHPDDELLSATLDGEGDPATAAHLGGCDGCLARLDALDRVRGLVGAASGPAPAGVADRAVAAATAAWDEERSGREAPAGPPEAPAPSRAAGGGRPDDTIVPLRRRPPRWAGAGREGRRAPGWAIGAVAALVAAVVAVPVLLRDSGPGERTASAPTEGAGTTAEAGADATVIDGGELGPLSDPAALRHRLEQALGGDAGPAAAEGRPSSDDDLTTAAPAARSPTPAATGDQDAEVARQAAGGSPPAACRDEVRAQVDDRLGPLVYSATLRWQGIDAVVLAYRLADRSGPGPDHLAFVMARDDCRVLASQGF